MINIPRLENLRPSSPFCKNEDLLTVGVKDHVAIETPGLGCAIAAIEMSRYYLKGEAMYGNISQCKVDSVAGEDVAEGLMMSFEWNDEKRRALS